MDAGASAQNVLEIENLSIALPAGADRPTAVSSFSLAIAPGEIVCLVGESGSGKSIVAFSTIGLLPPALNVTGGSIRVSGEDILGASDKRLRELRCTRISMIFQEPMSALNPVMRCGDQIDEVLREHTRLPAAERRERVLRMIGQVHLPDPQRVIESYPHQLSGGQRQRIMIAMALILEPALLVADEPTTALDVTTQAQILKLIRELQRKQGTGVLFITHDFGVVAEIADRVAVLRHGQLVELGPTAQILEQPAHPYTQMLIASVPGHQPPEQSTDRRRQRPDDAPVLQTRSLCKSYGEPGWSRGAGQVIAAADVELQVFRGRTLGIVGESGSGKSTVARCIARLIKPTRGEILVSGKDISSLTNARLRPFRRDVQIVFQDPYRSLNPRRTVGESIIEGPMNYGQSRTEAVQQARRLMERVRLDPDALERFPHEFSGGQRQRVAIARALAMGPKVLIADEAVSALDVSVQAQVLALLEEIREEFDLAMLFITHDLRVAAQVCDDVAVMSHGRVVEYGSAMQIFGGPQHPYTRTLLEAAPGKNIRFGTERACAIG
jgi:peptide/nickel transport system ATP-binding protein